MNKTKKHNVKHVDSAIQRFLAQFQKLENIIKSQRGVSDKMSFPDALSISCRNNNFVERNRPLIEDLNALRNVFYHRERKKYIAKINEFAIDSLDKLLRKLNNPPTVMSKFGVEVFQARVGDIIHTIMEKMEKEVYTHVPVWCEEEMIGVFSYTSFFSWLTEKQKYESSPKFSKKLMRDINKKYLNSPVVNYKFVPEDSSAYEIPPIFEQHTKQGKRLDCLLITENGKKNERITGIVTPWDLGRI